MTRMHLPQKVSMESEMGLLIMPGLLRSPHVEIVPDGDSSDIVVYHHHGEGNVGFDPRWAGKSIMLDYQDDPMGIVEGDWSLYFKRSMADKTGLRPRRLSYAKGFPVVNLPYCVKEYRGMTGFDFEDRERDFDVCCLFELQCPHEHRRRVVNTVESLRGEGYRVITGLIEWHFLRRSLSAGYFNAMKRSRVVVTCNPDMWEGDFRLFEALTTRSLVFCDEMTDKMGFDNDVVWYDRNDMEGLKGLLRHHLQEDGNRQSLADSAYERTRKWHTSDARVKFILETIRNI